MYFNVPLKMTFCVWRQWRISCKNKYGTHNNRLVSSGTTIPPQSKTFNPVTKEYLRCPFCSFHCLNEAELNRHIKSLHAPVINAKLSQNPLETYTKILGRGVKRTSSKELRFGNGLSVTLTGNYRGFWYDWSAGKGGGPIEAIQGCSGRPYVEAAIEAATMAGLNCSELSESQRDLMRTVRDELISESERALQEESRLKGYRVETAKNIWAKGQPLAATLAERYLVEHRGIPPEVIPRLTLKFLEEGATYSELDIMGVRQRKVNPDPALLVPIESPQGELTGVQRIYIDRFSGGKPTKLEGGVSVKSKHKFSLGSVAGNAGLIHSPSSGIVGGDVIVAEGPETCASLVAISPPDVHVVAALSVGNFAKLAKYIISKKPKAQVIFAGDNDNKNDLGDTNLVSQMFYKNCNSASAEIRTTWRPIHTVLVRPDTDGFDWNDVLVRQGREALHQEFWGKVNKG